MIAFVCWIASRMVARECQTGACDASTAMIKIDSKYFMVAPEYRYHQALDGEFGGCVSYFTLRWLSKKRMLWTGAGVHYRRIVTGDRDHKSQPSPGLAAGAFSL